MEQALKNTCIHSSVSTTVLAVILFKWASSEKTSTVVWHLLAPEPRAVILGVGISGGGRYSSRLKERPRVREGERQTEVVLSPVVAVAPEAFLVAVDAAVVCVVLPGLFARGRLWCWWYPEALK